MSSQLMCIVESADALQIVRRKFEVHQLFAALLYHRSSAQPPINRSSVFELLYQINIIPAGAFPMIR